MINEDTNSNSGTSPGMGLLGDYLKEKRVEKNYSLEKLSQKTKISVNILKSLESNDYDHLPSPAYIKGFVKSYVKVLGLPLDEAINKMEYTHLYILGKPFPALNHTKILGTNRDENHKAAPLTAADENPNEVIESDSILENTKPLLPFAIFAVIVLLIVGGYKGISSIIENEMNSQKPVDHGPKVESSSALVKRPEQKEPEPPKEEAAPVAKTTTPAATPVSLVEEKKEEKAPEFIRNFPPIQFKKVKGKLFSVKTDAPENNNSELLPDKIKSAFNPDLQNIYIKAVTGNTWLSYKIENQPIESVIVNQGNDLFLQGSEIRLFLGNVHVTKIFYNNYLIDTPTKSGVKTLIFPEESNEKFFTPLFPKAKDDVLYTAEEYMKRMKVEEDELNRPKN